MVEQTRFFLSQHDHSPGPVGETFEHCFYRLTGLVEIRWVGKVYPHDHLADCDELVKDP